MKENFSKDYSVITFATSKLKYVAFAVNCARSILLHNDINIYIVSNLTISIPSDLKKRVHMITTKAEHSLLGLGIKMQMDQYLQTKNTLFVDADCLCYGSLNEIFKVCAGNSVSVIGNVVPTANWCGPEQADAIKNEFGIDKISRFNAGLIFLKKDRLTTKVFETARSIIPKYDKLGFKRNNGIINEEALIAIGMSLTGQMPITDDGRYMTDLFTDFNPKLNVLKGTSVLNNPAYPSPKHRAWYPVGHYAPIVIHFGGNNLGSYIYRSQALLLRLHRMGLSANVAAIIVQTFSVPLKSVKWLISSLRNLGTKL